MSNEEIAEKYGMGVNPNKDIVEKVLKKIEIIKEKTGVGYCPCFPQHTKDTVCPCKYMRTMNVCRCGLYVPMNK